LPRVAQIYGSNEAQHQRTILIDSSTTVRLKAREGTEPRLLEKLRIASERSYVVQQTLLHPPR